MNITCDLSHTFLTENFTGYQKRLDDISQRLSSGQTPNTAWATYPEAIEEALVTNILRTAESIRHRYSAFVVIGIGGSYLGAKAGLELLKSPFHNEYHAKRQDRPRIYFAGHHLSSAYYRDLLAILADEEVAVCVISKSGGTLEPLIVFDVFKAFLKQKYGQKAAEHIYVITNSTHGALHDEAMQEGYQTFAIPENIGGRYSVLTPVGLLPLAVGGVDIVQVLAGARIAQKAYSQTDIAANACYQYALARHLLQKHGKTMEIFEVYDGELRYFTEWLKQLFAESGCKDGRGIFPASLQMSTDLHSMGQFLQDGRQDFFETAVVVGQVDNDFPLPHPYDNGKVRTMHQLNTVIAQSVRSAHAVNQTPNIIITLPPISPACFGQMVYFFEKACAISCYLDGVDPFDQPGVEAYKANIKRTLRLE